VSDTKGDLSRTPSITSRSQATINRKRRRVREKESLRERELSEVAETSEARLNIKATSQELHQSHLDLKQQSTAKKESPREGELSEVAETSEARLNIKATSQELHQSHLDLKSNNQPQRRRVREKESLRERELSEVASYCARSLCHLLLRLLLRKISLPSSPPRRCRASKERESTTEAEIDQAQATINRKEGTEKAKQMRN
jgi:hypothetical protein